MNGTPVCSIAESSCLKHWTKELHPGIKYTIQSLSQNTFPLKINLSILYLSCDMKQLCEIKCFAQWLNVAANGTNLIPVRFSGSLTFKCEISIMNYGVFPRIYMYTLNVIVEKPNMLMFECYGCVWSYWHKYQTNIRYKQLFHFQCSYTYLWIFA